MTAGARFRASHRPSRCHAPILSSSRGTGPLGGRPWTRKYTQARGKPVWCDLEVGIRKPPQLWHVSPHLCPALTRGPAWAPRRLGGIHELERSPKPQARGARIGCCLQLPVFLAPAQVRRLKLERVREIEPRQRARECHHLIGREVIPRHQLPPHALGPAREPCRWFRG